MRENTEPKSGFIPLESLLEPQRKRVTDLSSLREKLASGDGPKFWRTLEEAAESEELTEYIEQEFPGLSGQIPQGVDRRSLLKVMAASLAMAGAAACTKQPKEYIVPYVKQPENVIPGLPLFYATAMPLRGYAIGLLVESHLNRPTKVEGNPDHPASLGATGIFEQASVLNLYDPDRSQTVLHEGRLSTFPEFTGAFSSEAQGMAARKGEGLAILTGVTTSPTLQSQMESLQQQWPAAKWYVHEPSVNPAIASAARKIAGGKNAIVTYDLSKADVIVSLDSDFLNCGPAALVHSRQFSARRAVEGGNKRNRYYAVEATPTVSGSVADHRFPVRSSDVPAIAYQLAKACGVSGADAPGSAPAWLNAVVQDLQSAKGRSVVIPGEYQPEAVHLAAHAINTALGNIGQTVSLLEGVEPEGTRSIEELAGDLNSGKVEVLVIIGTNPVYSAPASLNFQDAIRKARLVVRLGQMFDETSRFSHWHVPEAHYLETWSDSRAFDGTVTIQQPLIEPLYGGKSAHEILSILLGKPDQNSHDLVKGYWQQQIRPDFTNAWQISLHNGWVAGRKSAPLTATNVALPALPASNISGTEIVFRPDQTVGDGDFANNSWCQELPKPTTKMTWDNVVLVSPKDAQKMNVAAGDLIEVSVGSHPPIKGPAWIQPGLAEGTFTVTLGYGRTASGRVANGIGYNAYAIQDAASPFVAAGTVKNTKVHYRLANVQETQTMAGREPVRAADFAEYQKRPNFPTFEDENKPLTEDENIYKPWPYPGNKWGMSIDLNVCTGCSACIIACQAENNIAVVGKDQVARGRHMHWIRVDRYYHGNLDNPVSYNQPVPCMHCEQAPCEVVCPVAATVHSNEGLNEMVYNRCVGTRYCSNNCPYKVRRFNFYLFSDWNTQSLYGVRNPDVTVRSRGVMEKCSYCVQRIQEVKIKADKENDRPIRDGEILTACQQVCPTNAITFGNLNDKGSQVAQKHASPRNYGLLDDLNTRPRTTYLGYVSNPNEALSGNRES